MGLYIIKSNESTVWEKTVGCVKQYRCALAVCLMKIIFLTLKINIYRSSGALLYGKDAVDDQNARDKRYPKEQMNRLSKILTKNREVLGMLHYTSNISTVSFEE